MVKELKEEHFREEISTGVTLIDFYATWCGPCRMITPLVEAVAQEFQGKAKVAKINIDEAQQVTADMEVTSIPTLILYKEGVEVKRLVGVKSKNDIQAMVQSAL